MQSAIGIGPLLQSVEFDAILPHGLHFHPAPSHTAPTCHETILPQSCGLWINPVDCGSIANTMQSSHDPDELQPNAANWSRIGPNRSRTGANPNWTWARHQFKTPAMPAKAFATGWGLRWTRFSGIGLRPKHRESNLDRSLDNPIEL